MVVYCSALLWYLDRDICFLHAEPFVQLSWSVSLYPLHRPCHTFQHFLQQCSMHSTDSALLEVVAETVAEMVAASLFYSW